MIRHIGTAFFILGLSLDLLNRHGSFLKDKRNFWGRKHMSLDKKTPAQIAIPELELGVNKWLDLIKMSKT